MNFQVICVPSLHSPLPPATVPSGQIHATERVGNVSATTHCWEPMQGLLNLHGFWHDSEIQESFDGQSWSTRHSGSGSGTPKIVLSFNVTPNSFLLKTSFFPYTNDCTDLNNKMVKMINLLGSLQEV